MSTNEANEANDELKQLGDESVDLTDLPGLDELPPRPDIRDLCLGLIKAFLGSVEEVPQDEEWNTPPALVLHSQGSADYVILAGVPEDMKPYDIIPLALGSTDLLDNRPDVESLGFICEGWTYPAWIADLVKNGLDINTLPPPSQHPDRREVLMVTVAEVATGETIGAFLGRGEDHVTLSRHIEGRMVEAMQMSAHYVREETREW